METENSKIEVIYIEPGESSRLVQIEDNLESMQELVGGNIEEYMPFDDEVAIVCNEEGKFLGMDLNRAITAEDGQVMDIIAGPFFIAYAPIENDSFLSLPEVLRTKYMEKFKSPERFGRDLHGRIVVKKTEAVMKEMER